VRAAASILREPCSSGTGLNRRTSFRRCGTPGHGVAWPGSLDRFCDGGWPPRRGVPKVPSEPGASAVRYGAVARPPGGSYRHPNSAGPWEGRPPSAPGPAAVPARPPKRGARGRVLGRQVAGRCDAAWASCACAVTLQDQHDVTVAPCDRYGVCRRRRWPRRRRARGVLGSDAQVIWLTDDRTHRLIISSGYGPAVATFPTRPLSPIRRVHNGRRRRRRNGRRGAGERHRGLAWLRGCPCFG
jgi:hypothetical protein